MIAPLFWRVVFGLVLIAALICPYWAAMAEPVRIGSKVFTESVILGELASQMGRAAGVETVHLRQIGGTRVLWEALINGEIDTYPEYTGTIIQELIPGTSGDFDALRAALNKHGIGITLPLGFNDTYGLAMSEAQAAQLKVKTISDLRAHPGLRFGFSNEFLERKDGWRSVRDAYALPQTRVTGLDHDLAYRAVAASEIDVIDVYTTDAAISGHHLRVLDDDRHVFPAYEAVFLYRLNLQTRAPSFLGALHRLEGTLTASRMIELNAATSLRKIPESTVASDFLWAHFQLKAVSQEPGAAEILFRRTREHLFLVGFSLAASILVAIPLGVLAFALPRLGRLILAVVTVTYTIPSLALLVFMIPLLGIGTLPAIVALFLYGLLPIVRNTHAGLAGIAPGLRESAIVLGLPPTARLLRIELPLAAPLILAGIKTAAVIIVSTATLGALVGAGGYGQLILTGIRLADNRLILLGAVPAAALALAAEGVFTLLARILLPRGLRIKARS